MFFYFQFYTVSAPPLSPCFTYFGSPLPLKPHHYVCPNPAEFHGHLALCAPCLPWYRMIICSMSLFPTGFLGFFRMQFILTRFMRGVGGQTTPSRVPPRTRRQLKKEVGWRLRASPCPLAYSLEQRGRAPVASYPPLPPNGECLQWRERFRSCCACECWIRPMKIPTPPKKRANGK